MMIYREEIADVYIEFYLFICQALISGLKNNIPTLKVEIAARTDTSVTEFESKRTFHSLIKNCAPLSTKVVRHVDKDTFMEQRASSREHCKVLRDISWISHQHSRTTTC